MDVVLSTLSTISTAVCQPNSLSLYDNEISKYTPLVSITAGVFGVSLFVAIDDYHVYLINHTMRLD